MATPDEVLVFLRGRYRKPVARADKIKDVVAPASISGESGILAGILAARFSSSISASFIAKSGRTAGEICDETILRARRSKAEERAARLAAFMDGRLSGLRPGTRFVVADEGSDLLNRETEELLKIEREFDDLNRTKRAKK